MVEVAAESEEHLPTEQLRWAVEYRMKRLVVLGDSTLRLHHTHIHACMHTYIHTYTHIYICIHTHIVLHIYIYTYAGLYVYMYIHVYILNTWVSIYMYMYRCMCICLCICVKRSRGFPTSRGFQRARVCLGCGKSEPGTKPPRR